MSTGRLKRYLRANTDWAIIIVCLVLALLSVAVVAAYFGESSDSYRSEQIPRNFEQKTYAMEAPDPKFPPPAKEQRALSALYTEGDIQYSLIWSSRNMPREPSIGTHSFTLELYNSLNKDVTLDDRMLHAVTVGCIAQESPYRSVTPTLKPLSFTPYERKKIELPIDVSCLYLGTADSKYYWRIY